MAASRHRLLALLQSPVSGDPERDRIARFLYPISLWILALMATMAVAVTIPGVTSAPEQAWRIHAGIGAVLLWVLALVRRGHVWTARAVFTVGVWSIVTAVTFLMGGIDTPTIAAYVLVSVLAGFLWGRRGVVGFTAVSIAAALAMAGAQIAGWQPPPLAPTTVWYAWLVLVATLFVTAAMLWLNIGATEHALEEMRRSEHAAVAASREVAEGRELLEIREREQAALAELGQHALAESDVEAILQEAARVIAATLDVSFVSVLERLPSDQELLLRAGVGWPEDTLGQARFPLSLATQAGYTLVTGEPVVVGELERENRFPQSVGLRGLGVVSSLSVVIPGEDKSFGVMGVHSRSRRDYSEDDIRFLEAVANLIALAIRRARAAQTLRTREEELRQAQKMEAVGRLAGGIAHDFNNLLTAISGYTTFLSRSLGEAHPAREDADEIRRMTERAASLTRQILAFSRRQVMRPEVIDVNDVIRDTQNVLQRLIGVGLDLVTDLEPGLDPVRADPGQIEQVLLNLVVNARDAMPEGGQLRIATSNVPAGEAGERPCVRLEVQDTGIGMGPDTMARAFDPFFTTKDRFKGTGLGLSTVYGIIQQSDGSIALDSQPGRGTSVRILLPAVPGARVRPYTPARAEPPATGTETLLLAEDEPSVRRLMRRILDECGYTVMEAADGAAALELAERHTGTIDLVITDVIMPEMGGSELAARMKDVHPEARVLYVSGYADDAVDPHGELGAGGAFLAKPFTADALARRVREVLDAET